MQDQVNQWRKENEEQRNQMVAMQQKNMDDFKNLLITAVGKEKNDDNKKTKCPKWDHDEPLATFT